MSPRFSSRASVLSWLWNIEQPSAFLSISKKYTEDGKGTEVPTTTTMPSPLTSSSAAIRHRSPPKRRRLDPDSSEHDDNAFTVPIRPTLRHPQQEVGQDVSVDDPILTPRGSVQSPVLSPPDPPSSKVSLKSVTTLNSTSRSKRSTSPVKTTQQLRLLEKPVYYWGIEDHANKQLSPDAHDLWRRIHDVVTYTEGIYPAEVEKLITTSLGTEKRRPPNHLWARHGTGQDLDDDYHFLEREFEDLSEIEHEAGRSFDLGRSEPAWNALVHIPLLKLGLRGHNWRRCKDSSSPNVQASHGHPRIALEPCPTARIMPQFVPRSSADSPDWSASKMVDIVLELHLDPDRTHIHAHTDAGIRDGKQDRQDAAHGSSNLTSDLHLGIDEKMTKLCRAIRGRITSQSINENFVNHTRYSPWPRFPLQFPLKPRLTMASEEEARVQLGIWTAAWHKRISRLVELGDGAIITLPLLIAVGHHWKLYFACDRGPDGIVSY